MLEIKNVSKTYMPKKGVPVRALDNVSLQFEDHGMVFILGKSGSGKSTLLNVLGGLDRADSGEFIIKGKSSSEFSQSDFDSYRNTFIGFIFQEYNILSEFTVGANIALAMELQGKKATPEALNALLEEVDLVGYGSRKPNELSGGQKQRVAIARALIKNPEMIMADEPTGALDSATGKQVFDTLKKLSEKKLVLIVSHDRDFAELYADRIIELKDGRVISDVSKKELPPVEVSSGVSVVDDKVIHIKKGYRLTANDLRLINDYISRAETDTLISVDADKNEEIKKAVKINAEGGKDAFLDTQPSDVTMKQYTPADSKLVRSRLPFKNSFKMGASGLKSKPGRLIFTIFLSFIAFALFGLADTMAAFNKYDSYAQSIIDSKINVAAYTKNAEKLEIDWDGNAYTSVQQALFTDDDVVKLKSETGLDFIPVYTNSSWASTEISFDGMLISENRDSLEGPSNNGRYYSASFSGIADISEAQLYAAGFSRPQEGEGRLPAEKNEVLISRYVYEHFRRAGFVYYDYAAGGMQRAIRPEDMSVSAILDKPIRLNLNDKEVTLTIVGVIDTHDDPTDRYSQYKPGGTAKEDNGWIMSSFDYAELNAYTTFGYHSLIMAYPGTVAEIIQTPGDLAAAPTIGNRLNGSAQLKLVKGGNEWFTQHYATLNQFDDHGAIIWADGQKRTELAEGEIIVPIGAADTSAMNAVISQEMYDYLVETFPFLTEEEKQTLATMNYHSITENTYLAESRYLNVYDLEYERHMKELSYDPGNDGKRYPSGDTDTIKGTAFKQMATETFAMYNPGMTPHDSDLEQIYLSYLAAVDSFQIPIPDGNGGYLWQDGLGGWIENEYVVGAHGYMLMRPHFNKIYEQLEYTCAMAKTGSIKPENVNSDFYEAYTVVGYYLPTIGTASRGTKGDGDDMFYTYYIDYNSWITDSSGKAVILSDSFYTRLSDGNNRRGYYSWVFANLDYSDRDAVDKVIAVNYKNYGKVDYTLHNPISDMMYSLEDLIEILAQAFLYIGIFFAVFAGLMMANFISVSISYKKREIGILRAVGARSSDVFGIFFNESLIITFINWILASATTIGVVLGLNWYIRTAYGFMITFLTVGIRQVALILAVGVVVAFLSSFIPVMRIARKRPIDAIQNR